MTLLTDLIISLSLLVSILSKLKYFPAKLSKFPSSSMFEDLIAILSV